MKISREIHFYKEYFDDFFETLNDNAKEKIDEVLYMISVLERIPSKFFKSIEGSKGLYEIRVEYESNIYRIFCCFDKEIWSSYLTVFIKKHKNTSKRIK